MFSKRGNGVKDLLPLMGQDQLSNFQSTDLEYGMVNGKLNALPVSFTARVLLWNDASLKRAGLEMPKTWDELFALGKQIGRAHV